MTPKAVHYLCRAQRGVCTKTTPPGAELDDSQQIVFVSRSPHGFLGDIDSWRDGHEVTVDPINLISAGQCSVALPTIPEWTSIQSCTDLDLSFLCGFGKPLSHQVHYTYQKMEAVMPTGQRCYEAQKAHMLSAYKKAM